MSRGFTYIELLISISLLSFLFLGMHAMQASSLHQAKGVFYSQIAKEELENLSEILSIASSDQHQEIIEEWKREVESALPGGNGEVDSDLSVWRAVVYWGNGNALSCKKNKAGESGCLRQEIAINEGHDANRINDSD